MDKKEIIDGIAIKGGSRIMPTLIQDKAINQLHLNHISKEKTKMLPCKSIYWINKNADIEKAIESCPYVLIIRPQPKDKVM